MTDGWCPHCHCVIADGELIEEHPLSGIESGNNRVTYVDGYPTLRVRDRSISEIPFDRARERGFVVTGVEAKGNSTDLLFRRADDVLPEDRE